MKVNQVPGLMRTIVFLGLTCLALENHAFASAPTHLLKEWLEPITFRIHQKKLSTPISKEFFSNPSRSSHNNTSIMLNENLIVSLGKKQFFLSEELEQQKISRKKIARKILGNKVKNSLLNYKRPFITSASFEEKVRYHQFKGWNLSQDLINLRLAVLYKEGKDISGKISKIQKKLKLEWKVLYEVDIEDLKNILKDSKVRNLIIIAHGNEQGILFDYDLNPYPKSLFTSQKQATQSIAIFSCYSEKASKRYQLDTEKIYSLYKKRYLFYLPEENNILSRRGTIYTNGLATFIKSVDKHLAKHVETDIFSGQYSDLEDDSKQSVCSLKISGVKIQSGLLQVILNKTWIGSLKQGKLNPNYQIDFDCSLIKNKQANVLLITHAKSKWPPKASLENFGLEFSGESTDFTSKEVLHFRDNSGNYSTSKIILH